MSEAKDVKTNAGLATPSWIVLILVAAVPIVFATGFSQFEILKDAVLVGGVGLALVVWAANVVRQDRFAMVAGRVTVLAVALGLYAVLALTWSPQWMAGAVDVAHLAALVGIVVIIASPSGRAVTFEDLGMAVAVGAGIAGVFGLVDWWGVGLFTLVWDPPGATGAFDAMEFAAAYYAVALPVIIGAAIRFEGWQRIVVGICLAVAGFHFGMMASWLYIGLFVAACGLAAAMILAFEGTETVTVLAPAAAFVALVVLLKILAFQFAGYPDETSVATASPYLSSDAEVRSRQIEAKHPINPVFSNGRMASVRSMETRSYLVGVAFELFQDEPIIGHGPGGWWAKQTKYPNADHPAVRAIFHNYPAYRTPHNGWARIIVEYGAIGFGLLALWLVAVATVVIGAMGRTGADADAISEQWALVAAAAAGAAFITLTPLLTLASASVVWVAALAFLTRRSAALNGYRGASVRWEWEATEGTLLRRAGPVALTVAAGVAMLVVTSLHTVSSLYRGWGDHLMLRTYYAKATPQYRSAHDWYPAHGDVLYNIALAASRHGSLDPTGEDLKQAVAMRPYDARILELRARQLLNAKKAHEAVDFARRAVNAAPNYVGARKTLASILRAMGNYNGAATQLVKILDRDPPENIRQTLHYQLGEMYKNTLGELGEALDHYEAALELATNSGEKKRLEKRIEEVEKKMEHRRKMEQGKVPPGSKPGGKGRRSPPKMPPGLKNMPEPPAKK